MESYSGTILLENEFSEALITLGYAPSLPAVQTFAQALLPYTTASIRKCTFTQAIDPVLIGSGGAESSLAFAAHFKFRKTDPNADIRFKNFRLPAPDTNIFEEIVGSGYRIKQEVGDAVAAAYSAFSGEDVIFDSGWLVR